MRRARAAGVDDRRRRALRRGGRPGLVHRAARRHRDDAGAGDGARTDASCRCRRSKRSRSRRRRARRGSPRGWTRSAAKCSRGVRRDRTAQARPLTDAIAAAPAVVARSMQRDVARRGAVFDGDGAVRYATQIRARLGRRRARSPTTCRRWPARSGASPRGIPDRAVLPHAVVPIYVRRPDAELARDRRARRVSRDADGRCRSSGCDAVRRRIEPRSSRSKPRPSPIPGRARRFDAMLRVAGRRTLCVVARRRAQIVGVLRLLGHRRRAPHQHRRGRGRRAGARGIATRLAAACPAPTRGVRRGDARGPALEHRGARGSTNGSASRSTAIRPGLLRKPDEDGLILWRNP